jgi:hypothetical protein
MPLTSAAGSSKIKYEAVSKMPSQASTPGSKPGSLLKRTLQDAFAEGSARESEALERLGTQKHECAIGELALKRRKLENKAMEKQHQREREREHQREREREHQREREREHQREREREHQREREREHQREREREHQREHHEFHMLQMRMMLSQNQQTVPGTMQRQNQSSFGGLGLMDELNDPSLPSESPGPSLSSFMI